MPTLGTSGDAQEDLIQLELADGYLCQGYSYGADKSVSGELVFQTGMVGYPESLTDPSYEGQILVCTFPLAGNYGVPSRDTVDSLLKDLPAYFEASKIHVAGLITASYSGENFSHFLAESSLGKWLKENGVPAMHGVDTRALTKRIRVKGSMLGRMMIQDKSASSDVVEDATPFLANGDIPDSAKSIKFKDVKWHDQNAVNLVAQGET